MSNFRNFIKEYQFIFVCFEALFSIVTMLIAWGLYSRIIASIYFVLMLIAIFTLAFIGNKVWQLVVTWIWTFFSFLLWLELLRGFFWLVALGSLGVYWLTYWTLSNIKASAKAKQQNKILSYKEARKGRKKGDKPVIRLAKEHYRWVFEDKDD